MRDAFDSSTAERALRTLGDRFDHPCDVEVVLVGGAAAMLTGLLPAGRTTLDCDVLALVPEAAEAPLLDTAARVARELELPMDWFNMQVQLLEHLIPAGWQSRRVLIGAFGRLRVFAASRPDLIAMKVLAGRPQDLEDLSVTRVRIDEVPFVRAHLDDLERRAEMKASLVDARDVLDSLELHDVD